MKQRWFWVDTKINFVLMLWSLRDFNIYIDVEKITLFQRWNNFILSTLNQCQILTLKQHWIWVDTQNFYWSYVTTLKELQFLFLRQNGSCTSTSKQRHFINVEMFRWNNADFGLALQTFLLYVMIIERFIILRYLRNIILISKL